MSTEGAGPFLSSSAKGSSIPGVGDFGLFHAVDVAHSVLSSVHGLLRGDGLAPLPYFCDEAAVPDGDQMDPNLAALSGLKALRANKRFRTWVVDGMLARRSGRAGGAEELGVGDMMARFHRYLVVTRPKTGTGEIGRSGSLAATKDLENWYGEAIQGLQGGGDNASPSRL